MTKALILTGAMVIASVALSQQADEPQPRVVDPGAPGKAPSDAVVLFDGTEMSKWMVAGGGPAKCDVRDSVMACATGTGNIFSRENFGSAQIHVEFAVPSMPGHKGQLRGNSGVYIHGRYEVQVLDSYNNPTYPNGSAGALYGQYAPLVNASRPPEQWQTYDIVFRAPKCDASGNVIEKARLTLLYNGVLVQDHVEVQKPTNGVCGPGPLMLQDHSGFKDAPITVMRYRNIWFRRLD